MLKSTVFVQCTHAKQQQKNIISRSYSHPRLHFDVDCVILEASHTLEHAELGANFLLLAFAVEQRLLFVGELLLGALQRSCQRAVVRAQRLARDRRIHCSEANRDNMQGSVAQRRRGRERYAPYV